MESPLICIKNPGTRSYYISVHHPSIQLALPTHREFLISCPSHAAESLSLQYQLRVLHTVLQHAPHQWRSRPHTCERCLTGLVEDTQLLQVTDNVCVALAKHCTSFQRNKYFFITLYRETILMVTRSHWSESILNGFILSQSCAKKVITPERETSKYYHIYIYRISCPKLRFFLYRKSLRFYQGTVKISRVG